MNPHKYILPIAIASLTMSAATSVANAGGSNVRLHKMTVSLKAEFEGDHKFDRKDNGDYKESQKILTMKISTKEILEGLVEEGVIGSIKGWSLHLATNDDAKIIGTYISKKNYAPINVSQYFGAGIDLEIEAYKSSYKNKTGIEKGDSTYKSMAYVMLDIDGFELEAGGILETKTSWSNETNGDGKFAKIYNSYEEFVKSAKFSGLSGEFEDDDEGLVTGSIKAGSGKEFTVNN